MTRIIGLAMLAVFAAAGLSASHAASGIIDVEIQTSYDWGVIPFDLVLRVVVTQGSDSIVSVAWDFESDGTDDAYGVETYHTFDEAVDYLVTAEIETAQSGTILRTKPVSGYHAIMTLAFDDGHISVWTEALPLMDSLGVTGGAYIVPDWIGGTWYMIWDYVQDLHDAGWDIESHSMTHRRLTELDDSTLHWELSQSQIELQSRGFPARHFAAPYTAHNEHVIDAIKLYYESNHIGHGVNPDPGEVDPYLLLTHSSHPGTPLTTYQAYIDSVISIGGWYIMLNHKIAPDCYGTNWCIHTQMLGDVIDYALQNRVNIVTVDDALGSVESATAGIGRDSSAGRKPALTIEDLDNRLASASGDLRMRFALGEPARLDVAVYDVRGRRVKSLFVGRAAEGCHSVSWSGDNDSGRPVGSGTYFITFVSAGRVLAARRVPVIR